MNTSSKYNLKDLIDDFEHLYGRKTREKKYVYFSSEYVITYPDWAIFV